MSFLKLEKLSKRCGDLWALRDVSLEIGRGEVFGLLGASGAGKSVLLRLIAGLDAPNSGEIFFDGDDITRFPPEKRGFGAIFQGDVLPPAATVAENIAFHLKSAKISKDEINQRIREVLNLFELSEFENRRSVELSGGVRQLAALARQIAAAPPLLLLDSPLSDLDPVRREKTLSALKDWVKKSQTVVLYATQNLEETFAFCDRAVVLAKGEILQTGTPEEIYAEPANSAVAGFFGRNNLIRAARLTSNKAALSEFQTIEGEHRLFVDNVEKRKLGAINQIVTLMIRPENLILTFGAAFPEDNLLKAEITEIKNFGATTRILLDARNLKLEAQVIRLIGLKIGDVCLVGLPPNRIKVLKD